MFYPRITFRKSAKKDFETLHAFAKDAKYDNNGRNLNWAIFNKYPQLKTQLDKDKHYKIKNEKSLRYFVYKTYQAKWTAMDRALTQHRQRWTKIAPHYFSLIDALFNNRKWPRGKYIAFGTIWGMYPRFLKDKTFQIPFWHRAPRYISVVIAHELLHFMFYDYFYEHYPKYHRPEDSFFVWHISEIFNSIIQNSPQWLKVFELKSMAYPEHKKIITKLEKKYHQYVGWDVDKFIKDIMKAVKKSKL